MEDVIECWHKCRYLHLSLLNVLLYSIRSLTISHYLLLCIYLKFSLYIDIQIWCILDINTVHVYLCICDVSCLYIDEAVYGIGKTFHHENKE